MAISALITVSQPGQVALSRPGWPDSNLAGLVALIAPLVAISAGLDKQNRP